MKQELSLANNIHVIKLLVLIMRSIIDRSMHLHPAGSIVLVTFVFAKYTRWSVLITHTKPAPNKNSIDLLGVLC